jgi:hypothetical protein
MREAQDFVLQIIARAVLLHEENERLKKELRSRRRQGDVWRKRAKKAEQELQRWKTRS